MIIIRKDLPADSLAFDCSTCHALVELVPKPDFKNFMMRDVMTGRDHGKRHGGTIDFSPISGGAWSFCFSVQDYK